MDKTFPPLSRISSRVAGPFALSFPLSAADAGKQVLPRVFAFCLCIYCIMLVCVL